MSTIADKSVAAAAPDSQAIAWSYKQTAKATALSRRTIEKLVSSGQFPQPRVVNGKRLLFVVEEVRAWLQALPRHAS